MSRLYKTYRNHKEKYVAFNKLTEYELYDTVIRAIKYADSSGAGRPIEQKIDSLVVGFALLISQLRDKGILDETLIEEIVGRVQNASFF